MSYGEINSVYKTWFLAQSNTLSTSTKVKEETWEKLKSHLEGDNILILLSTE